MSDDDPFDELDESVDERDGDPFERLEGDDEIASGTDTTDGTDDGTEDPDEPPWGDASQPDREESDATPDYDGHDVTPAGHQDELGEGSETAESAPNEEEITEPGEPSIDTGPGVPAEDPFADVGTREGDPFEDSAFERMDTGEIDPDAIWERLSEAQERGSVADAGERTYAEVSKHRFCEQCEFFSDPPEIACSHDGTEILEFVDQETVRLVDCPVVAEREELEKHE